MPVQVIRNGTVFDGDSCHSGYGVVVEQGRIAALLPEADLPADAPVVDLAGGTLLPGFVDLQVNGGGGLLFNDAPSVDTLRTIAGAHRNYGTTGLLPTLISDDYDVMRRAVAAVDAAIESGVPGILGIHLEGPFLNPERCGVHDAARLRPPDDEGYAIATSLRRGRTLVTLAPEICGPAFIRRLVDAGVIVSAGHTQASFEDIEVALAAGMRGFTHLYNAMSPLQSRAPGAVGAALADDRSWFGIIADGHHSHPAALRIALRARPGAALLVTDAMPTVGGESQGFALHGEKVHAEGGCLKTADGTLAGSSLDMLSAVNNAARMGGIDWFEAARMASLYPARALGLDGELGVIAPGARANLLALDAAGRPRLTWVDGNACRARPA